jgi:hypothetical protein
MAVEASGSAERQIVAVTWDKEIVTGEIVQLYCVNPDNGDVSNSGFSRNDGSGYVTYPPGYVGSTEVTVYDNDGNADFGVITVGEDGTVEQPPEVNVPVFPTHPIVLPPETDLHPEHPIVLPPEEGGGDGEPTHPIVLPPEGIWPNPPEGTAPIPEHPIAPGGPPPEIWPGPGLPTHPIVLPPFDGGYDPGGFNPPPDVQPVE